MKKDFEEAIKECENTFPEWVKRNVPYIEDLPDWQQNSIFQLYRRSAAFEYIALNLSLEKRSAKPVLPDEVSSAIENGNLHPDLAKHALEVAYLATIYKKGFPLSFEKYMDAIGYDYINKYPLPEP